jgi:hypothetical protein
VFSSSLYRLLAAAEKKDKLAWFGKQEKMPQAHASESDSFDTVAALLRRHLSLLKAASWRQR